MIKLKTLVAVTHTHTHTQVNLAAEKYNNQKTKIQDMKYLCDFEIGKII